MGGFLEAFLLIALVTSGIFFGKFFSRVKSAHWLWGYFLPLIFILFLAFARHSPFLSFNRPFGVILMGRGKFFMLALAVSMGLMTTLPHLPLKTERILVYFLMVIVLIWFSVLPLVMPAVVRDHLSSLSNRIDSDGVCLQSTDYTCAPAAAVTVLETLGLSAHEGQLAVRSYTNPVTGTLPMSLSSAIENSYSDYGLKCNWKHFDSIEQLEDNLPAVAVVKDSFFSDHCVAILEVHQGKVCYADPAFGRITMDREHFEEIWKFSALTISLDSTDSI